MRTEPSRCCVAHRAGWGSIPTAITGSTRWRFGTSSRPISLVCNEARWCQERALCSNRPTCNLGPMSQMAATEMEWKGRTGPFTILLNPGVFSPTHTSRTIADALEIGPDDTVIDVGCGSGVLSFARGGVGAVWASGVLSFVAARLGAKRVIGCDISEEAVEAATKNAMRLGLSDRVEFRAGGLLDPVRDCPASLPLRGVS